MKSISNQKVDKNLMEDVPRWYVPKRHIFAVLGFLGIVCSHSMRVSTTVALVAMVNWSRVHHQNLSDGDDECMPPGDDGDRKIASFEFRTTAPRFNWDANEQGMVLGSFFYGYFVTVMFGGFLAQTVGSSRLFGGGILVASILSLLMPSAANLGLVPLVVLRSLTGIAEGLAYPSINAMIGKWAPEQERSRIYSTIFSGISTGTVLSKSLSGFLCIWETVGGWPSVYYFFGGVGCLWSALWIMLAHDSPETHPSISAEELSLFCKTDEDKIKKRPSVRWKKILTSLPMWVVLVSDMANYLTMTAVVMEIPTYFKTTLHFRIETIGLIAGLPHLLESFGALVSSFTADKLINSGNLSTTAVRKIFNSICFYGGALCLMGIPLSGCHYVQVVAFYCIFLFIMGAKHSGCGVTHVDMCPPIAGILYGILTSISCVFGIFGPVITSAFISSGVTLVNWSKVFYITAGLYAFAGTAYCLFAESKLQPWLEEKITNKDTSNSEKKL